MIYIYIYILVPLVLLAAVGGFFWWRSRRAREPRLISLVALLREPTQFDPAVLARVAGKAWKVDLGDGSSEGDDGFVAGVDFLNTIMCKGQMYLVNCFPTPYMEDVEEAADSVPDMR